MSTHDLWERIPEPILNLILFDLDFDSITNLCSTSPYLQILNINDEFWRPLFQQRYPKIYLLLSKYITSGNSKTKYRDVFKALDHGLSWYILLRGGVIEHSSEGTKALIDGVISAVVGSTKFAMDVVIFHPDDDTNSSVLDSDQLYYSSSNRSISRNWSYKIAELAKETKVYEAVIERNSRIEVLGNYADINRDFIHGYQKVFQVMRGEQPIFLLIE